MASFDILASGGALYTEYPTWDLVVKYLIGITVFLILNALFVAAEFGLVKVRKSQLIEVQGKKPVKANLALHALGMLDGYLSAGQLGITVASLVLGMLGEPLVAHFVGPFLLDLAPEFPKWLVRGISITIAAISFSFVHVIIGEQVPKVLAIRKPVGTTLHLIGPLHLFYKVFGWAIHIINSTANFILKKVFRVEPAGHTDVHSATELALLVEESGKHDEVTDTEREILINALELNDISVKDVMTPRSEVVVLDVDSDFEKNLAVATRSQHTRFPLVKGHLDHALGLIHIKDILTLVNDEDPDLIRIKRPLKVVPETMALDVLLQFFLKEHAHLAMVVDEHGDPAGLVFMDNIMEELVGDIQDEFDSDTSSIKRINENEFITEGALTLNELSDHIPELDLESGDITTVGGYITRELGYIPELEETLVVEGYEATVTSTDGRRVEQVLFRKIDPNEESKAEGPE
ncbi:MAG: HlyC/CorC family transporter [Akkermansiaceae bacterium]|nr:HlyC/CorC family transporter [Akkermansiaceae bacterium]